MRMEWAPERVLSSVVVAGVAAVAAIGGCALFESERVSEGRSLYRHYCMHCHGENGRQNEGFNWINMPDPRPRDLAIKNEMQTFTDEQLFETMYRDMKDTSPEGGDPIGEDEFAVPTMPTFKYTLSENEIWSLVAFVRSLHGMSLSYDVEAKLQTLRERVQAVQVKVDEAKKELTAAEEQLDAAFEAEEDTAALEEAMMAEEAKVMELEAELAEARAALENFTTRPRFPNIPRPEFNSMVPEKQEGLVERGKRLFFNKYGCNGCHSIGDTGGAVGPPLDRAGFRLNDAWIYRWIRYPQGMKRKTKMPNLGISDEDARALTVFLKTLRAPKPTEPAPPPE